MKILSRPVSESCSDCGRRPVSRRQGTTREQRSLYLPSWAAAASFPLWVTWEPVRKGIWQRHRAKAAWSLFVRWIETNHIEIKYQFRKNTQSSLLKVIVTQYKSPEAQDDPFLQEIQPLLFDLEEIQDVCKTIRLHSNKLWPYEFIMHILLTY